MKINNSLIITLLRLKISQSINVDDLIILVGQNLKDEFKFSQGTINKIIEVGKRTEENKKLALSIIRILGKIPLNENRTRNEIEKIFNKLLSKISQSKKNVKTIVNLREEFLKNLNQYSNLLQYLHEILVQNRTSKNRRKALKIFEIIRILSRRFAIY